ncbi:MAG: DUF3303 family protein [Anaerolineales bacterium]
MLFVVVGDAKPEASLQDIRKNRADFIEWEQTSPYAGRYRTVARYEWVGAAPKKTFWIMQAEDPEIIHGLVEFFADVWNVTAYPVVQRSIGEAT